jgi:hypothetical protein
MAGKIVSIAERASAANPIQIWKIGKVKPNPDNEMIHSEDQVKALARSLTKFGWTMPLLVDTKGTIVAGHGRLAAARLLGLKTVEVRQAPKSWTPEMINAYRIADNRLPRGAKFDPDKLFATLGKLKGLDMLNDTGFTLREFEGLKPIEPGETNGGGNYSPEFQVVVICPGEESQRQLLDRLTEEGFKCKALMR